MNEKKKKGGGKAGNGLPARIKGWKELDGQTIDDKTKKGNDGYTYRKPGSQRKGGPTRED